MSQEKNVETLQTAYHAWNRGDLHSVLDHLHPDVEWEENPDVYPGLDRIYRGHDGFLKRQRDAFDIWEWFRVEGQEFIDAGEHVVVSLHLAAKGRYSGIEVEMTVYEVFTFQDGKVARHRLYASRAEALKAVGGRIRAMSQESTTPDLVERWRQTEEAFLRRDFDAMMSFYAPDAVWDGSSAGIGAYFEGATAIRSFLEEWLGAYEEYEHKQEKAQDLGNGVVFAVVLVDARLAGSAGRVQERWSFTVTWTEGMIARVVVRADIDNARAAAEPLAEGRE